MELNDNAFARGLLNSIVPPIRSAQGRRRWCSITKADCLAAKLRPGNVHIADGWRIVAAFGD